ncbi:hypothetical protein Lal_00014238 [Lupinus albus]|nr:hypothetical protein Lal_00014238 [Lupinus albus]
MANANRFEGRRAIVTGGASGIGLAVAARLATRARRPWTSRMPTRWPWRWREPRGARRPRRAGVQRRHHRAEHHREGYPAQAWRRVIDVNLNGLFYCNQAAVPAMERNGYGRIVNVASIAGKEGNPNASAYSASKAGVIGFTKSLGKELAKTEIRVNCVTPAAVRTAIFDQMTQSHIDFMLSKIPVGRFGAIEEVSSLICWLASEEASFSTGAVFDVSGGRATY